MGTRNLTIVKHNDKYKVAQYGQWDGYPSGQGVTVLEFARTLSRINSLLEFTHKVDAVEEASSEYIADIEKRVQQGRLKDWALAYPELSRDTCAKILKMIMERPAGLTLRNDIEFAADSLFCEWAYVIDLDEGTLEAFVGFNKLPLKPDDRFYFLMDKRRVDYIDEDYYPIKLFPGARWRLNELPTVDEFLATFREGEEADDA